MSQTLLWAFEYYENSVAMRASSCRRSRFYLYETFSPFRCPVRFLELARYKSLTTESVCQVVFPLTFSCRTALHGIVVTSFQICYDGWAIASLETWIQAIQLSPCGQDLQRVTLHIFGFIRFLTMLLSPLPFDAR